MEVGEPGPGSAGFLENVGGTRRVTFTEGGVGHHTCVITACLSHLASQNFKKIIIFYEKDIKF